MDPITINFCSFCPEDQPNSAIGWVGGYDESEQYIELPCCSDCIAAMAMANDIIGYNSTGASRGNE